jgi:hypothetical protein
LIVRHHTHDKVYRKNSSVSIAVITQRTIRGLKQPA